MTTVPPGFEVRESPSTVAFLRSTDVTRLERAGLLDGSRVLDPERFFEAHRAGVSARGGVGRGTIVVLGDGTPEGGLLLKKYRRGGLASRFLPDLFLSEERMLADLAASERLRAFGVPTAAILALVFVRGAGPLTRGYVLTEEVGGAATLADSLRSAGPRDGPVPPGWAGGRDALALAERAVLTVRRMHDAGVLHRDLNLGNLLVAGGTIVVIDLDGAEIVEAPSSGQRFANLSRLDRSYIKAFGEDGPLSHDDRRRLLGAYAGADHALEREMASRLAGHKRSLARHRTLWRSPRS